LGWSLFGIIWLLACLGISLNLFCFKKTKPITFALYFVMGWLVVVAVKPLVRAAEPGFLLLLLGGGLCYTLGIVFYAMKKIPFHHGIWHLFVLSGSICHFLGFLFYLT
jgi:hemolysin III